MNRRDIKPSNVLVSTTNDKAVPKIIDLGTAKATTARLTEKTVATEFGQMIGTPEYMSPEQAGELDWIVMNALEKVRTRRYESASAMFSRGRVRSVVNTAPGRLSLGFAVRFVFNHQLLCAR